MVPLKCVMPTAGRNLDIRNQEEPGYLPYDLLDLQKSVKSLFIMMLSD